LSKYVTDLENHLGVRLMNRSTRKLSLTRAGEDYYREVGTILQQLDELDSSIGDQSSLPQGHLRISAPRNFGETSLAPAIFDFMARHPQVSVDLRLEDRRVDLVAEGVDLALRISAMPDSSLIVRKIVETHLMVMGSPDLIKLEGEPKTPEDLRGKPCIIDTNMDTQTNWHFTTNGVVTSVHVGGRVTVNSPIAAREAAKAGLGFALLPSYLAEPAIGEGILTMLFADHDFDPLLLQAVYPHRRHLPARVRALIDHLTVWFADRPVF